MKINMIFIYSDKPFKGCYQTKSVLSNYLIILLKL